MVVRRSAVGFFGNWAKHHERQTMTDAELKKYREELEWPMEELAMFLDDAGVKANNLDDYEIIQIATRKLKMLHKIAATTMNEELLKAVMAE